MCDLNIKTNYDFGITHGYKASGVVSAYLEVSTIQDIKKAFEYSKKNNLKILPCGEGSNILIVGELNALLVQLKNKGIEFLEEKNNEVFIKVASGCTKDELNNYCCEHGYSGLEFWAGIPGLVGGGLKMNAGAYGTEVASLVHDLTCVSPDGIKKYKAKELKWSYRNLDLEINNVIFDAVFKLTKAKPVDVKKLSDSYIQDRKIKHPLEYPSCGSVFKNPNDCEHGAWWYIKEAGLSGYSIGGAMVSTKHSNFIINSGSATATNVVDLINHIKNAVNKKFSVWLQEELKIYD